MRTTGSSQATQTALISPYTMAVWPVSALMPGWVMDYGDHDVSIFAGHDYAMLGDIHKTNQILDEDGRVRYCGSIVQQNHGETNDKGFLIWEIDSKDDFAVAHL